ncbi:MAG: metal ABC transporter solute-binding protein, Zn/Mn family [Enterococcus sp.]
MKNKLKKGLLVGGMLLSSLLVTGCKQDVASQAATEVAKERLSVYTTFYPIYEVTKYIVGDVGDVEVLMKNTDPHSFEPSTRDVAELYDADVFVYHSHTFEKWTEELQVNLAEMEIPSIEAADSLELQVVEGLEEFGDLENASDPHTWLDPLLIGQEALNIGEQLAEVDAEHKEHYLATSQEFNQQMIALDQKYQEVFKDKKQRYFVTQHTAFSYLAERYGLKQLGIAGVSNELEPNSRQLAEVEEFVKANHVDVIYTESNSSPKIAKVIQDATGAQLKVLSPLETDPANGKDFIENLAFDLETIAKNMK